MAGFFAELKRRNIYCVAAAYAVVGIVLQLVNEAAPSLDLSVWIPRALFLPLLVAVPITSFIAWLRELVPPNGATGLATSDKLDRRLIGTLVVVIALVSFQQSTPSKASETSEQVRASASGIQAATNSPATDISVGVLPFENLSTDTGQEFFSAGITEEIASALAKIPDLRVVARASAFQFKGQKRDIHAIAQALHATHFVEGSVHKAGTHLHITAQLINAASGVVMWTENYDREYPDVFVIQEDIASAIAGALGVPLGLKPGRRLVSNRTSDLTAYEDYLRVRVVREIGPIPNSRAILERAVARAPGFAPAWEALAERNMAASNPAARQSGSVDEIRTVIQSWLNKAETAARRAIELDPDSAGGYAELGTIQFQRGHWADGEKLILHSLMLDSGDPDTLQAYGSMLMAAGRLKDALRVYENLVRLEPLIPIFNTVTALAMHVNGEDGKGIALLEAESAGTYNRYYALAMSYAAQGQYAKAADTVLKISDQVSPRAVQDAAMLLRGAPMKVKAPQDLPTLQAELSFAYAHVGALDRVMEYPERLTTIGYVASGFGLIWDPLYAPLRKTERFKALVRNAGLVDYWRARGWPDLCRPLGADDFVCD